MLNLTGHMIIWGGKTLHQSYNDGMVNPEVVCHPSMAKTTVMHATTCHLSGMVNFRRTIPNQ
jgi:hypothetical protein